MSGLGLILFDCDGTLADSEYAIVAAMQEAFAHNALPAPDAEVIRSSIGLSVPSAIHMLLPEGSAAQQDALADAYRDAYFRHRAEAGSKPEPLFDGIANLIRSLASSGWQLGVATGKSQRGLLRLLNAHGLNDYFATLQTADFHPSKPDPSMVYAALDQTLVPANRCVVIGDTSFDMTMARNAHVGAIGVTWGYHDESALRAAGAQAIAKSPSDISALVTSVLEERQVG